MSISQEDRIRTKGDLLGLLRQRDTADLAMTGSQAPTFGAWLEGVQSQGWTRKDVYDLIWDILKNYPDEFSESTMDELAEVETG